MIVLLSVLLLTQSIHSYQDELALTVGFSYSKVSLNANHGTTDEMEAIGFNSHYGYKWKNWTLELSSYLFWGSFDELTFQARDESVRGNGSFSDVSFGPILKYHFDTVDFVKGWSFYAGIGPTWSMQSIRFDNASSTGNLFSINQKITYESFGGVFNIGIEEISEKKENHPFYIEVSIGYKRSYEVSVVDKSDFIEVETLSKEERKGDLEEKYIAISFGIIVF